MRPIALLLLAALVMPLAAGDAAAPKIAVLRLQDLLSTAKAYKEAKERIRKQETEAQAQAKTMDDELKKLETSLQVAPKGSDRQAMLLENFEVLKLRRQLLEKRAGADLDRQLGILIRELFKAMRVHLAAYCQEKGIMLVHLAPDPDLVGTQAQAVQVQLGFQTVLYWDPSTDITDAFLAYLNQRLGADGLKLDARATELPVGPLPEGGAASGGQ